MSRRGHTLLLIMVVLGLAAAAAGVFLTRLSAQQTGWRREEVRVQALWLARSALTTGIAGRREVATPLGPALVNVAPDGGSVEVRLQGGRAVVTREPWNEGWVAGEGR
ncbi:MAG: hypothetical protein ABIO70_26455 [Pseudomonadota bacterium]